ncbi:uncharacterized protein LOC124957202 [Vespa velutina]|uniref:uncharacterized protein LOC124957202 n=1 Tax=Vespa velutina TaxID=202808 RepID=UPI001FB549DF|nr:uncharacterized protein LOC124957202 [Vespa velutina]
MDGSMIFKEEDFVNNEYYVYNRLLFRLLGLWEYQTSYTKLIYVCYINISIIIGLSEEIYILFTLERKIASYAKLLEIILPSLCHGSCYYNLLRNGVIMKNILYRIKCDWNHVTNQTELKILKNNAHLSKKLTIVIAICYYLYIAFLMIPSCLSNIQYFFGAINKTELMLPVRFEFYMKSQIHYYFQLSLQYQNIIIFCTVGVAYYSMFVAMIQHACALFNIVEFRINERFKREPNYFCYANSNAEFAKEKEWLVDIIIFHNNANQFVNLIKLFYEKTNLLEMLFLSIFIMLDYFHMFQILSFNISKTEGLRNICYIVVSLIVVYTYFFFGQKLIDHNKNVFVTLCQVPFYLLSLKTQKMLLFLTMKSMRVCNFSVQGVNDVSYDMFASVIDFEDLNICQKH